MLKKYLLGLDLGTDSCGWCVTNEEGKIVRKNGKCLWGVRLFEEAEDCKGRRLARSSRRRTQRRRERIDLLKFLFAKEISKVDDKFFIRLNEAQLHQEDKSYIYKYTLFNDNNFTDKEFYKQFKTIYHLRKYLLESDKKEDPRLIYLALAHMIKYRGHFLFEGSTFNASSNDEAIESFKKIKTYIDGMYEEKEQDIFFPIIDDNKIAEIKRVNKEIHGINKLKDGYMGILYAKDDVFTKNVLIPLLAGGKIGVAKLINKDEEFEEFKDISCKDIDYDIHVQSLMEAFPNHSNEINCLVEIKKIFDFLLLNKLLADSESISFAMVKRYEIHNKELSELKQYVKTNCSREDYSNLFRDSVTKTNGSKKEEKLCNYASYIGFTRTKDIGIRTPHCEKAEFYKFLKKILKLDKVKKPEDIENDYLRNVYIKMSEGTFLARQNSSDNRVLPYQLNLNEMEIILKKQSKYYEFLNEKDEFGTVSDKIISILKYKIPYYVGPLSTKSPNSFGWIVRSEEKIYPWNFNKVVDKDASAEAFIKKMLNKCTYLNDEFCMPKNSIIFSYYLILNELNKMLLNGKYISKEEKLGIIKNVYCVHKKVTKKEIIEYLSFKSGLDKKDIKISSSNDKEIDYIQGSLKTYIDFEGIFGEGYVENHIDEVEDIIKDISIFEDKSILVSRLHKKFNINDEAIINKIKNLNYSGFATLSCKLLTDLKGIDENGEIISKNSILSIMEETNLNFMEVINKDEYGFMNAIMLHNSKLLSDNQEGDNVEDFINKLYVSPGMKRPLIQSYKIIEEVEKIIKHPIDEYYIECTRSNKQEKKKQKDSRKDFLAKLYKKAMEINKDIAYKNELKSCSDAIESMPNERFRSDKIFLYFTQLGKDIYTGQNIPFDELDKYDIDHIYPQSKVKDDSLDNRVLVSNSVNHDKSDIYPIPYDKFSGNFNHYAFQKKLLDMQLIKKRKFDRLVRKEPLDDSDLYNFVSRQIIYTSQSVKALKDLVLNFKVKEDGTKPKVIMSKAEVVSDFRKDHDLLKCREANDMHHAHDAFLNIIVGRAVNNYYGENLGRIKYLHDNHITTNINKIFEVGNKPMLIVDSSNNVCWNGLETLKYVDHQIKENRNMLFTTRAYIGNTLFKKTSIKPAKDINDFALPLKQTENGPLRNIKDPKKYGGYTDLSFSCFTIFKSDGKEGNIIYTLIAIPGIVQKLNNKEKKIEYAKKEGLINPTIEFDNLKINSVLEYGHSKMCITGKSGKYYVAKNLNESYYSYQTNLIIKKVVKVISIINYYKGIYDLDNNTIDYEKFVKTFNREYDNEKFLISPAGNQNANDIYIYRYELDLLLNAIKNQLKHIIYENISSVTSLSIKLENNELDCRIKNLNIFSYCYLLNELLIVTQVNRVASDLRIIDGSKNSGILSLSKEIKKGQKFIGESITGFYSKVLWEYK